MRIIAGRYRGRVLKSLPGLQVRPTGARLRQSLFDVLGASVEGSVFLDCYAGSGAVGLEALSRGARQVFLIEDKAAAHRLISQNVTLLGSPSHATVVGATVFNALRRLEHKGLRANFCFFDPPYRAAAETLATLRWLVTAQLLQPDGLIIVQHERNQAYAEHLGTWNRVRLLTQGSNALSFYRTLAETAQDHAGSQTTTGVDAPP
ncbi:MAG: 16S rRNA (guanine(966)-N(2))-methyltransferase RsmD [Acidobacteria bacterium]|nr:16S rRNA (guanine(966)-N(2))-methyltransferase RsmD [Acidobacteriota bacterium]